MKEQATLLIIDLECTCNDDPPLARDEVEIIEIGAVIGRRNKETGTPISYPKVDAPFGV